MLTSEGHEQITEVRVTDDELVVALADGRTLSVPLVWYPSLLNASAAQRSDWELIGDGEGIHWPQIDEDLSAEGLLRGIPAVRPRLSRATEISNQIVSRAKDFYAAQLGQIEGKLGSSRSQLESLLEHIPEQQEEARAQIQELVDSYEHLEYLIDEAVQTQDVEDTVQEVVGQAQETAGQVTGQAQDTAQGAAQQAQDAADQVQDQVQDRVQEAVGQVADQAQGAVGQAVDRTRLGRF
jgi:uncharacterized protein YjbJ (UPF0337 family)